MRHVTLLFACVLFVVGYVCAKDDKRTTDSPNTHSIMGGGFIDPKNRKHGKAIPESADGATALLQVEMTAHSHLLENDGKYSECYESGEKGQEACNTCWAFVVKNMLNARRCRAVIDAGKSWDAKKESLTPLNMICDLQSVQKDDGICDAKNIYGALDFIVDTGLVRNADLEEWMVTKLEGATVGMMAMEGMSRVIEGIVDISKPDVSSCQTLFRDGFFKERAKGIISEYAPSRDLKNSLLSGPVVATIRLTWQFQVFNGTLFNPEGNQTFCRQSKIGDKNDYCDPAKTLASDTAQLDQQKSDAPEETWYNHFVTVHGWGSKTTHEGPVPYWIVENSWGRIYDNDPEVDNNGAGKAYRPFFYQSEKWNGEKIYDSKNHFVLIADRVAGQGGLEMTNREVYRPYLAKEEINGLPQNNPSDEIVHK